MELDLNETKQFTIELAKEAGKLAMKSFGQHHDYTSKEGRNQLVTKTDVQAENLIKSAILEKYPDHAILAEESADSGEAEKDSEYLWIIDPIDGTRNYIHNHPSFGVSIALAKDKQVVLGVVYFPVYDWTFTAVKDKGAEMNGKKINVSKRTSNEDLLGNFGCNFHKEKAEQMRILDRYIDVVRKIRVEGAATFGFCLVANGTYDSYIQRFIKPWDYAASCLIIEEAGGKVTDYEGKPWTIDMDKIIATNGNEELHKKILKCVGE